MSLDAQTQDTDAVGCVQRASNGAIEMLVQFVRRGPAHEFQYCLSVRSPYTVFNVIVGPMSVLTLTLCLGVQCLIRCAALRYQAVGDHALAPGRWEDPQCY